MGSQSLLGSFPEDQLPVSVTMARRVAIAPFGTGNDDALADQLSYEAGESSEFHAANGFYLEGARPRTAILPRGWENRLVPFRSAGEATGLCLDPHDLCAAKLMVHRPNGGRAAGPWWSWNLWPRKPWRSGWLRSSRTHTPTLPSVVVLDGKRRLALAFVAREGRERARMRTTAAAGLSAVDLVPGLAAKFCPVHSRVRLPQQLSDVSGFRRALGDAHAQGDPQRAPADDKRLVEGGVDPPGDPFRPRGGAAVVRNNDGELGVAPSLTTRLSAPTQSRRRCPGSTRRASPPSWPSESLTSLKSSISMNSRPSRVLVSGSTGAARRSASAARLPSPVSSSWVAR